MTANPTRLDWAADAATQPHPWVRVMQARVQLFDIQDDVAWLAAFFARYENATWWDWPDDPPRPPDAEAEPILTELRQALACWSNIAVAARSSVYGLAKDAQIPELARLGLVPTPDPNPASG